MLHDIKWDDGFDTIGDFKIDDVNKIISFKCYFSLPNEIDEIIIEKGFSSIPLVKNAPPEKWVLTDCRMNSCVEIVGWLSGCVALGGPPLAGRQQCYEYVFSYTDMDSSSSQFVSVSSGTTWTI